MLLPVPERCVLEALHKRRSCRPGPGGRCIAAAHPPALAGQTIRFAHNQHSEFRFAGRCAGGIDGIKQPAQRAHARPGEMFTQCQQHIGIRQTMAGARRRNQQRTQLRQIIWRWHDAPLSRNTSLAASPFPWRIAAKNCRPGWKPAGCRCLRPATAGRTATAPPSAVMAVRAWAPVCPGPAARGFGHADVRCCDARQLAIGAVPSRAVCRRRINRPSHDAGCAGCALWYRVTAPPAPANAAK